MRKRWFALYMVLLTVVAFTINGVTQEQPKAAASEAPKAEKKAEAVEKKKEKKKPGKPFDELVEDYEVIEGLFTFYRNADEGKVYMEIKPEQFEKLYLCAITREAGDGYYFDSSSMMGDFPFILKRVGMNVQFIHKNVYFRADEEAALSRAVKRGLPNSIVGNAKIESQPHPERGSLLINPASLFVQDVGQVGYIFNEFIKKPRYSFDKSNSYFSMLKSFPHNSEIEVSLNFKSSNPRGVPTIPDARSFQHVYHYSLAEIPESNFKPRHGDDRVGHFLTMHQDYTSALRETPYVRYVNRWHLEKAEPRFDVSPPKKPIVFWIENTVPVEYRDAVREGTLLWNTAFEKIGFRDAVVVKQMPDDATWDPADVRYSTIRWIVQPGGGYAVGPSRTNPFTGELYDADIRISADYVRYMFTEHDEFTTPVARGDSIAAANGLYKKYGPGACDYADGKAKQVAFGWSLLTARSAANGKVDVQEYIHNALVDLVAHEVGHTLGLRHNFKASTTHSLDELQNVETTTAEGLTGSVMDYNPVNIARKGENQGVFFHNTLGTYDYWAIEYAYKPVDANSSESEKAMLERIASKVADPKLTYGTDEDAFFGPRGIDPRANRYDMGADPIAWFKTRLELSNELWGGMESQFEKKGGRYQKLRRVFQQGLGEYYTAAYSVPKYIGGLYHNRDHIGDPNGRMPFEPVSATKQREALDFLTTHILGPDAFNFSAEMLNKLAPERFSDFSGSVWNARRIDYPVHDAILSIQSFPLNHLYNPLLLSRMVDIELRFNGSEKFTMADMFSEVRNAVWAEVENYSNINSFRRNLQRRHLAKLVALVVKPGRGVPEDACTMARADLSQLKSQIEQAVSSGSIDAYTKAHLEESQARIEAALQAGLNRQMGM